MPPGDFWLKLRNGLAVVCYAVAALFGIVGLGLIADGLRRRGDKLTAKGPWK
jgi:hypothetical protein